MTPAIAIIKREFLSGLRSAKPFLFLGFLMLVMIGGLVFVLREILETSIRYNGAVSGRDVRAMFMIFSIGLYFSALLLVPPMAGVSICIEKQQDSYDLLRMTYIRPFSLAIAKLMNILGIYGLITVATLPILGVFFFLVGIDWTQLLLSAAVILVSALSCAVIGLLCSAYFYRTLPAIITTYIIVFFFHGGFLMLAAIMSELLLVDTGLGWLLQELGEEEFILALAPFSSLILIGEGLVSFWEIVPALFFHGAVVGIGLGLTLVLLGRPAAPMRVEAERPIDDQAELAARRKKFPYYLLDPRRRRPQIADGRNPMLAKERQTGLLGRGTFGVRVFYIFTIFCFVVSLITIMAYNFNVSEYGPFTATPVFIETVLVLILAPTLIATAMAKEHEWGNMDMLRMTLLEPRQIVDGKFRSALYTAALPVAGGLLGCLPVLAFTYHSSYGWAGLASGLGTMIVCVAYALTLSLLVTVTCRRALSGLMLGYAACILTLILVPFMLIFWWEVILRGGYSPSASAMMAFTSPLTAQVYNMSDRVQAYQGEYLLNSYWLVNILCFSAASMVCLALAKARFTHHMRRGME